MRAKCSRSLSIASPSGLQAGQSTQEQSPAQQSGAGLFVCETRTDGIHTPCSFMEVSRCDAGMASDVSLITPFSTTTSRVSMALRACGDSMLRGGRW